MKHLYALFFISFFFLSYAQDTKNDYLEIPYRVGNKWGLADTLGTIKIKPIYDDILEMKIYAYNKKSFYFFKSGNKTVIADEQGKNYLQEYDSIDNVKNTIYLKGKVGLFIDYRPEKEVDFKSVLPAEYDEIVKTAPETLKYIVKKGTKKGLVDISSYKPAKFLLEVKYDSIIQQKDNWIGYGTNNGKLFTEVYRYESNTNVPDVAPRYDPVKNSNEIQRKKLEKDTQKIIANLTKDATPEDLKSIAPITVQPFTLNVAYEENGKTGIASFYYALDGKEKKLLKQIVVNAEYDSIAEIGLYKYIIKNKGKYGILTSGGFPEGLPAEYDSMQYYPPYSGLFIVKKGKKYAVYSLEQHKFLSDFVIDKYRFESRENGYCLFVQSGNKKGIKFIGSALVPPIYDDITFEKALINYGGESRNTEFIKLKSGKKYGVLSSDGKIQVPVEFDDVSMMPESGFFMTTKDNLKGSFYSSQKVNIPAKYKSIRLFETIYLPNDKSFLLFEAITIEGKKILVGANGKEYYSTL